MSTSGPLNITTRTQLRQYLGTVAGKHHSWPHLAIRHNSLSRTQPCRFCDGAARPSEGPMVIWDTDPLCPACAAQVAPELALYLATLEGAIRQAGGNWRDLGRAA